MDCFKTPGVALVTGGAAGIGRATALALAESGATAVVIADLNAAGADSVAAEILSLFPDCQARGVVCDATDAKNAEAVVANIVNEFGRIDFFVHSVGIAAPAPAPVTSVALADIDRWLDVNTRSVIVFTAAVLRAMEAQEPRSVSLRRGDRDVGRGSIVHVLSANSLAVTPGKLPYVLSKHASLAVTKTAAIESAAKGIRVNYVAPTWTRTQMYDIDCANVPATGDIVKALMPIGRIAEPEEVAEAIVFLLSPGSTYVTGSGILVDAGLSLQIARPM